MNILKEQIMFFGEASLQSGCRSSYLLKLMFWVVTVMLCSLDTMSQTTITRGLLSPILKERYKAGYIVNLYLETNPADQAATEMGVIENLKYLRTHKPADNTRLGELSLTLQLASTMESTAVLSAALPFIGYVPEKQMGEFHMNLYPFTHIVRKLNTKAIPVLIEFIFDPNTGDQERKLATLHVKDLLGDSAHAASILRESYERSYKSTPGSSETLNVVTTFLRNYKPRGGRLVRPPIL